MQEIEKTNLSPHTLFVNEGYSDKNKERNEELSSQCLLLCLAANIILKASLCAKRDFLRCHVVGAFFDIHVEL